MKSLVVYYSRTGNTELVAKELAKELGSDIEEIVDIKKRSGLIGLTGAVINPRGKTAIKETRKDPRDYDIVIIGTPIWWYTCAPGVTEYLKHNRDRIRKTAFFYTCGADKKINALKDMEDHLGKAPICYMGIEKPKKNKEKLDKKVKDFVGKLRSKAV